MAEASHSGARPDLADYYHWEEPARSIRIYMSSGMADRLQADVRGSTGGKESGGILLGRVESGPDGNATIIEDFIAAGADFEAALLRAALDGCRAGAPAILGYY